MIKITIFFGMKPQKQFFAVVNKFDSHKELFFGGVSEFSIFYMLRTFLLYSSSTRYMQSTLEEVIN